MDDSARSTPESPPREEGSVISAMILGSLAPPTNNQPSNARAREPYLWIAKLAKEWQQCDTIAGWCELHAIRLGLEQDRVQEIVGCIAAAGEQLGLAWTAQQDMQRWLASESDGLPMATRAFAEMCSYFTLGSANVVANATFRTLLLNSGARSLLIKKRGRLYSPFSDDRRDWLPFDRQLVKDLKAGVRAVGNTDAEQLIFITENLWQDERWKLMVNRRGRDYHRWRPQSIEGGVPRTSLWVDNRLKRHSKGVFQAEPAADHLAVSEIATNGLLALADVMRKWLNQWPSAMAGVGAKMFKTP